MPDGANQPAGSEPRAWNRPTSFAPAGLILLQAILLAWSAVSNSVTADEFVNLPAGAAHWKYSDFTVCCVSPPLVRLWAALPILAAHPEVPPTDPARFTRPDSTQWIYGTLFQNANRQRYQSLFVISRLAMIPISCLAAWLVFRWTRDLFGQLAALAACLFFVLCPNVLAHGSLVTTDMSVSTAMAASLYLWWRFCRNPSWKGAVLTATVVAVAQVCKFTALFLWIILPITAAHFFWRGNRATRKRIIGGLLLSPLVSLLLINAAYLFHGSGSPLRDFQFTARSLSWLSRLPAGLPIPLPRDYIVGFDAQMAETEGGYAAFMMDEVYEGSKWYYYPFALACKLPLTTLVCGLASIAAIIASLRKSSPAREGILFLLLAIFVIALGSTILTNINIGVRYILPIFPLAMILTGALWQHLNRRWVVGLASALLLFENLSVAPRYLTFINRAAGGSSNYLLLNDSNFDWGQGLLDLRDWLRQNHVDHIGMCYFGSVDPGIYGIDHCLITELKDEKYVAISSYFLAGLWHRLPSKDIELERVRLPFYRELRARKPVAVLGSTIFVFEQSDVRAAAAEAAQKRGLSKAP